MLKRFLVLAVSLITVLSCVSLTAFAELQGKTGGDRSNAGTYVSGLALFGGEGSVYSVVSSLGYPHSTYNFANDGQNDNLDTREGHVSSLIKTYSDNISEAITGIYISTGSVVEEARLYCNGAEVSFYPVQGYNGTRPTIYFNLPGPNGRECHIYYTRDPRAGEPITDITLADEIDDTIYDFCHDVSVEGSQYYNVNGKYLSTARVSGEYYAVTYHATQWGETKTVTSFGALNLIDYWGEKTKGNTAFGGWFYDSACTKPAFGGDTLTRNIDLYSGFGKKTFIEWVKIGQNTGIVDTREYYALTGTYTPTKSGYKFAYWCYDKALTKPCYQGTLLPGGQIKLYPKMSGGTLVLHYTKDGAMTELSVQYDVIRYFYLNDADRIITGWYYDAELTQPALDGEYFFATTHLYAKEEGGRVTYVTNIGTEIESELKYTLDDLPYVRQTGYYFCGWYTDPEFTVAVTEGTEVSGAVTLYGKYEQILYVKDIGVLLTDDADYAESFASENNYDNASSVLPTSDGRYFRAFSNMTADINDAIRGIIAIDEHDTRLPADFGDYTDANGVVYTFVTAYTKLGETSANSNEPVRAATTYYLYVTKDAKAGNPLSYFTIDTAACITRQNKGCDAFTLNIDVKDLDGKEVMLDGTKALVYGVSLSDAGSVFASSGFIAAIAAGALIIAVAVFFIIKKKKSSKAI